MNPSQIPIRKRKSRPIAEAPGMKLVLSETKLTFANDNGAPDWLADRKLSQWTSQLARGFESFA